MSDPYLEAAAMSLGGLLAVYGAMPERVLDNIEGHASDIIEAWIGDRTLYYFGNPEGISEKWLGPVLEHGYLVEVSTDDNERNNG